MVKLPSQEVLKDALFNASNVHHEYETTVLEGVRDEQWPGFYAAYVLGRLGDFTSASHLSALLEEVPAGSDWASEAAEYVHAKLM